MCTSSLIRNVIYYYSMKVIIRHRMSRPISCDKIYTSLMQYLDFIIPLGIRSLNVTFVISFLRSNLFFQKKEIQTYALINGNAVMP